MAEIFVNYRTGDGDSTAALLEREIEHRFGPGHIFRASSSILAGNAFPSEIYRGVQECAVLIAVIGPSWATSPKLQDPADWVRREIAYALAAGTTVLPVLVGRRVPRINPTELPDELAPLGEIQSWPLDPQKTGTDLSTLGDLLVHHVPLLAKVDRARPADGEPTIHHTVRGDEYPPAQRDNIRTDDHSTTTVDYGTHGNVGGIHGSFNQTRRGDDNINIRGNVRGGIRQGYGDHNSRSSES
ncbi:toll/interleukin-1 receptor domain-containing protein [Frankia sp. R82]|uniref:toll/interleukin-1 receptor domain-containing protein n=1 Tax=Frankia sp. R82 TaxID=2950553 RepID=UPI0020447F9F|nr:toll/interleukin-1 receptor domain-containing protein [Frankia sp. R82]MCM3886289.1 toll/interleukin-1 receptor domain-containing protein [Frankia sp. R82]